MAGGLDRDGRSASGPSDLHHLGDSGLSLGRHRGQEPGQKWERGRFEAERRRVGGYEIAVLRPSDDAAIVDFDLEQTDVAHALEVWSHRVGVKPEHLGNLVGGTRRR